MKNGWTIEMLELMNELMKCTQSSRIKNNVEWKKPKGDLIGYKKELLREKEGILEKD